MKRILLVALLLFLWHWGPFPAVADTVSINPPVSGGIVGGYRVLQVPAGADGLKLAVYRGDYVKFKLAGPATETMLSIPDLSIEQKLSGSLDAAPYFKMEKTGVFPFVLGTVRGSIAVIDYQQANYREVVPRPVEFKWSLW